MKEFIFFKGKTIGKIYVVLFFLFLCMYLIILLIGFIFWDFEGFGNRTTANESSLICFCGLSFYCRSIFDMNDLSIYAKTLEGQSSQAEIHFANPFVL